MKCTATELRKTLFTALDKAASGEPVEIDYKGKHFRLTADQSGSKLARLKPRNLFLVDPDSIVGSDTELMSELEAKWEKEWKEWNAL